MTSAPADLTVHLEPPPGWVQIPQEPDDEGAVLLALAPAQWRADWGVRPNIVVGLGAPVAGSIRAVATRTAATFLALEAGHRIVSWDLWQDDGGRRLLVTYPAGTALVAAMTWLRLEGDRPLSVTATVDADRYLRVMPLMTQAVGTLRVEGTATAESAPAPATEGAEEPRDDDFWVRRGETLEDLGRLQEAQPWTPDGLRLSRAAFAAFAEAGRGLRGPRVKDRSAVEELQQAGLVDAAGRLSEDGRTTHAALAGADRRIRVESAAAGVPGTFEAARYGDTALVWATDPPSRWAGGPARGRDALESATTGTLQWVPLMHLPEELAAWLQVGPAWPMATSPQRLLRELVTRRAEDERVPPPPDADDHLRAAWAEPWFTWVLTTDTGHAVAGVRAGRHGHFRLEDTQEQDDAVDLQAFPAEPLFATLVGVSLL